MTVPAHNELNNLNKCVKILIKETAKLTEDFKILIAEDGSNDGTDIIAKKLKNADPRVFISQSSEKLGRGLALKRAWSNIEGDIFVFVDADLATNMRYYPKLIKLIKEGNDLATGSRYKNGAIVNRPILRDLTSKVYNKLIRIIFKDGVYDHQIGFKAFSRRLILKEINKCKSNNWFWDTEIIVKSIHDNYRFVEFPVEWEEKKGNKTPIRRLIIDIIIHGTGIIKLQKDLSKQS